MNDWIEKEEDMSEYQNLQKERLYMILLPDEKDLSKFTVKIADTTSYTDDPNIAILVLYGIMDLLDEGIEELADRGHKRIMEESIKGSGDNVAMFKPNGRGR